jgi:hypothetical protein
MIAPHEVWSPARLGGGLVTVATGWVRTSLPRLGPCLRATHAAEYGAEERAAPLGRRHPRPHLPRRVVPHVLRVAALELGHPMLFLVAMETHDPARWPGSRFGLHGLTRAA